MVKHRNRNTRRKYKIQKGGMWPFSSENTSTSYTSNVDGAGTGPGFFETIKDFFSSAIKTADDTLGDAYRTVANTVTGTGAGTGVGTGAITSNNMYSSTGGRRRKMHGGRKTRKH